MSPFGQILNYYVILAEVFNLESLRQNKSNFFATIAKDNEQADPLVVLLSEKYIKLEPNKLHIVNCSPVSPHDQEAKTLPLQKSQNQKENPQYFKSQM